jgi:hypothetical protein
MSDKSVVHLHSSEDEYYDYCLAELKEKQMWGQADYIELLRQEVADLTKKLKDAEKDAVYAKRYQFIREDGYYVVPDGQYIP